ncbi:SDR family NAD(P)-dependent oxidoreductase [Pseudoalteromonas ulvae]|uniref:Short-chain dehydrogenase n=1 Tax=Pseudoalteromonas ulvae TaxID=107327 RepID=A0A244CRA7_PSEDV|nr:SDR family NAD(P)-dependent oxidoreductase [Pseudoalteromonas ulvae]OUL58153.1 short-chain dehydrogenase [Pseudoalteromonas ulvae]
MKTVLITGASSGIGQALCVEYASLGYQVYAGGRNQERLEALAKSYPNVVPLICDLTDLAKIQSASQELPALDLLILNAGNCEYIDDPINFDAQLFNRVIQANLISVANSLSVWLKLVKQGGTVAFNSSSATFLPLPRAEAYGASKAAVSYLANTLRIDLKSKGIHVSLIHPGFVETPLTEKNTFPMPSIVTAEQAAVIIRRGLDKNKNEINFPRAFIFIMKLMAHLPNVVWQKIALRMI